MITPNDLYYLGIAREESKNSPDPSTKTGAVIVKDGKILSTGYNKFPPNVETTDERLNNRDEKLSFIIHCEMVALILSKESVKGATLYTWPFMSCSNCAGMFSLAEISRVVAPHSTNPRWIKSFEKSMEIFKRHNIIVDLAPDINE